MGSCRAVLGPAACWNRGCRIDSTRTVDHAGKACKGVDNVDDGGTGTSYRHVAPDRPQRAQTGLPWSHYGMAVSSWLVCKV
jgi:hypothetical protein